MTELIRADGAKFAIIEDFLKAIQFSLSVNGPRINNNLVKDEMLHKISYKNIDTFKHTCTRVKI